jgi:hypothetical protein
MGVPPRNSQLATLWRRIWTRERFHPHRLQAACTARRTTPLSIGVSQGATWQTNMARFDVRGRSSRRWAAIAAPAGAGSGRVSTRRVLVPARRSVPSIQLISSRRRLVTSLHLRPGSVRHRTIAKARRWDRNGGSNDRSSAPISASERTSGNHARRQCAARGNAANNSVTRSPRLAIPTASPSEPWPASPARARNRRQPPIAPPITPMVPALHSAPFPGTNRRMAAGSIIRMRIGPAWNNPARNRATILQRCCRVFDASPPALRTRASKRASSSARWVSGAVSLDTAPCARETSDSWAGVALTSCGIRRAG